MAIEISIQAGLNKDTSSVLTFGSVQHVITDTEVKSFSLQDGALKEVGLAWQSNPGKDRRGERQKTLPR